MKSSVRTFFKLTFIMVFTMPTIIATTRFISSRRDSKFDNIYETDKEIFVSKEKSTLLCFVMCINTPPCKSISYNIENKVCQHFSRVFINQYVSGVFQDGWLHHDSLVYTGEDKKCLSGWVHHGTSCYLFNEDLKSWQDALDGCKALSSLLVTIESHYEQTFIVEKLQNEFVHPRFWIGGVDQYIIGDTNWYWLTGQLLKNGYTNWYYSEPDNVGMQHCLSLRKELGYKWSNDYCHETIYFGYICESTLFVYG